MRIEDLDSKAKAILKYQVLSPLQKTQYSKIRKAESKSNSTSSRQKTTKNFLHIVATKYGQDASALCAAVLGSTQIANMKEGGRQALLDSLEGNVKDWNGIAKICGGPLPCMIPPEPSMSPFQQGKNRTPIDDILGKALINSETLQRLTEFVHTKEESLLPLAKAFASTILRVGGWSHLSDANRNSAKPFLLPAAECWIGGRPPDEDEYMDDLILNVGGAQIFVRGEGRTPTGDLTYWSVLKQLPKPDPVNARYIMSIPGEKRRLRIPEALKTTRPYDGDDVETQSNITPQYCHVDLHMDLGAMAVTATAGRAEKLIVLFPPTEHNLGVFRTESSFVNAHQKLEEGIVMVMTPNHGCFIPPGWLHTLYTIKGGITATLDWSCSACLEMTSRFIEIHHDRDIGDFSSHCGPFLEAVLCCLREGQLDCIPVFHKILALLQSCDGENQLRGHGLFSEVEREVNRLVRSGRGRGGGSRGGRGGGGRR